MIRRCAPLLLLFLLLPLVLRAQVDSARAVLARTPYFQPTTELDAQPGVFAYRFDAPGWPEALSLGGLPPPLTTLALGRLPFDDLITGTARYDLLPPAWLDTLYAEGAAVQATLRPFDAPRPRTEGRYLSGPDGFQSIEAIHAQGRRRRVLGEDGVLRVVGGYAGRAADNEYDNSRLRRGRATLLRLSFDAPRTGIEIFNLHTRGTVGAPDGVRPVVASDPGSIYDRFNATVNDPTARRRTVRNDTGVRLRRDHASLLAYRTYERFEYTGGDSLARARAVRYGVAGILGGKQRALDVDAWWMHTGAGSATDGSLGRVTAVVRDTLGTLAVRAGIAYDGTLRPVGSLQLGTAPALLRVEAEMITPALMARHGFGEYVRGPSPASPYVLTATAQVQARRGAWQGTVRPFATLVTDGYDYRETRRDTLTVFGRDVRRAGVTVGAAWRGDAPRGLYATGQVTALVDLASPVSDDHPPLTSDNMVGLRATLFSADLALDLYARMQAWTAFDGRVLHDPTGVLALAETAQRVPASATLDLAAVMGVRGAMLFFIYENALSGTPLLRGNLLVPETPLPARRLRFGVFWPIFD